MIVVIFSKKMVHSMFLLIFFLSLASCKKDKPTLSSNEEFSERKKETNEDAQFFVIGTGQEKSVMEGDDAYWSTGKSIPQGERFIKNGGGVFLDRLTGLVWMFELPVPEAWRKRVYKEKDARSGVIYFSSAEEVGEYLDSLNGGSLENYNKGYSDWRWPAIEELTTLLIFSERNDFSSDGSPRDFPSAQLVEIFNLEGLMRPLASCTPVNGDEGSVWSVFCKEIKKKTLSSFSLVLVRSLGSQEYDSFSFSPFPAPINFLYARSSRGKLHWDVPRFEAQDLGVKGDSCDDVVLDRLTGLTWTRTANPSGKTLTWYDAINFCNKMKIGGFSDWRLPNSFEMLSLICYEFSFPAIPNTEGNGAWNEEFPFVSVESSFYWTSTSGVAGQDPKGGYAVNLGEGDLKIFPVGHPIEGVIGRFVSSYPKHFVWPVRGGIP